MTGRTPARHSLRLYGRTTELAALAALADRVRSGRGAALVLAAEPGLGRTALLEQAVRDGNAGTVLHVRAAPAERDLPYSGVNSLLTGAPPQPDPPGEVPPACTSPTGLLEALRRVHAREPLLVCVDDAHLWDAASRAALGYAARRAGSLPGVGLLMSVAAHRADAADFAGLPVVRLGPLAEDPAATLVDELAEELTGDPADPNVREAVLHEAIGNPALLIAVVRRLSAAQLAGHAPLPRPLADGAALLRVVGSRLEELPVATRQLLLLVAAAQEQNPDGAGADATLLMRAARAAGFDPAALDAAEAAGVTRSAGNRIRFDDPLLLRAVLSGAALSRRRAAHRLLAAVLGGERHRLSRLLHRALAADGPDPALAACLAAAADSPDVRATPLERSVAFGRAARLTPPGSARTSRLTAAAEHAWFAGDPGRARDLLAAGRQESAHDAVRGCAELVRGTLALHDGPVGDAYEILMLAAALLGPYDQERMLTARLGATEAAWSAGDVPACLVALGGAARTASAPGEESSTGERSPTEFRTPAAWPPGDGAARPGGDGDLFHDYRAGMLHALGARLDEARRPLRRVLDRAATDHDPARLVRAGVAALVLGNIAAACHVNARALAAARARNLVPLVPQILEHLAYAELRAGRHARARAHAEEGCAPPTAPAGATPSPITTPSWPWPHRSRGPAKRSPHMPKLPWPSPARTDSPRPPRSPNGLAREPTWDAAGPPTRPPGWVRWCGQATGVVISPYACSRCPATSRPPCSPESRRTPPRRSRSSPCGRPRERIRRHPPNSRAAAPCWLRRRRPRLCTSTPWSGTNWRAATSNAPAPCCCTGSGCGDGVGCGRPGAGSGTRCSPSNGPVPWSGPSRRGRSCGRPAARARGNSGQAPWRV